METGRMRNSDLTESKDDSDENRILCVGTDPSLGEHLTASPPEPLGLSEVPVPTAGAALDLLDSDGPEIDCLVSAYELPESDGIDLLTAVREDWPDLPFVLVTDTGSEQLASEAIRQGVTDYVPKQSGSDFHAVLRERIEAAIESDSRAGKETTTGETFRQHFDAVVERTTDALWFFSADWSELQYVTGRCEDVLGCSREAFGRDPEQFLECVHPADRNAVEEWRETLSGGQADTIEYRLRSQDGREKWVVSHGEPITDADGTVSRIAGFTRDVTDRKERMRVLKRERFIVRRTERIADLGSWELSAENRLRVTDGAQRVLGIDGGTEFPLEDVLSIFTESDRAALSEAIEDCRRTGEPFEIEGEFTRPDGRQRCVRVKGQCRHGGSGRELYGTVQDITEQKEREQRLMVLSRVLRHNLRNKMSIVRVSANQLENEFGSLEETSEKLYRVGERLQSGSELGDSGLQTASGPGDGEISAEIRERVETLADGIETKAETGTADLERIIKATDDLTALGGKVREFEQAIESTDRSTAVQVRPLLEELADEYREKYPAAHIELSGPRVVVHIDRESLQLATRELIENAVTHSTRDDPTVEIEIDTTAGQQATIRVADDGPGIPDVEREVLREGEEAPLSHGSGIGLWTVDLLMTRCGGGVAIEDNEPTGTVVELTVPAVEDS